MTNIHARGIERKMPTGMAWHGMSLKAVYKAIGGEFLRLVTDLNDRCNADNQLLGEGLVFWEKALGLPGTGTLADRQAAIKQRLGDSGGITITDITNALHEAGFTNLYAHPNYEYLDLTVEATPMGLTTQMGADTQMSHAHIYTDVIDPAIFENFTSYETMGLDTQMGLNTQMGYGSGAGTQGIVVNNLPDDSFSQIPRNPAAWTGVFFVCGEEKLAVALIPESRKKALKLLLQTVKPFNTVAILLVEYTAAGYIAIGIPQPSSTIYAGDTFSVSGTTDLDDGTTATLAAIYPDETEIILDTTEISGGAYAFTGQTLVGTYGEGNTTLRVSAGDVSADVTIRLALHSLAITSPAALAEITIGSEVTITGTTDFADGSIVTLYANNTQIGMVTVTDGGFSYTWTADGEAGSLTFKASCGGIEDTVTVTLVAESQLLSITSTLTADTPSVYVNHVDVSITSTVTADTPTNI